MIWRLSFRNSHRNGRMIHMRSSFIRTAHANDQMNYSLNLKEELISGPSRTGKRSKKTFLFEGFFPTEKFSRWMLVDSRYVEDCLSIRAGCERHTVRVLRSVSLYTTICGSRAIGRATHPTSNLECRRSASAFTPN